MTEELKTILDTPIEEFANSIKEEPTKTVKEVYTVLKVEFKKTGYIHKACVGGLEKLSPEETHLHKAKYTELVHDLGILLQLIEDRATVCAEILKERKDA